MTSLKNTERQSPAQKGSELASFFLKKSILPEQNWSHARLPKSKYLEQDYFYRNFSYLNAQHSQFQDFQFRLCNLQRSHFGQSIFRSCIFDFSDLSYGKLNGCRAMNTRFIQTNLSKANLQGSLFYQTNFQSADLSYSNCEQADFRFADLRATNFQHSNIRSAIFTGAKINQQTLERSGWTSQEREFLSKKGAIWCEDEVAQRNFAEGFQIHAKGFPEQWSLFLFQVYHHFHEEMPQIIGDSHQQFILGPHHHIKIWKRLREELRQLAQSPILSSFSHVCNKATRRSLNNWLSQGYSTYIWLDSAEGITVISNPHSDLP